jgi:hypothetical protein
VTATRTARLPGRRLTAPRLTALLLAGLIGHALEPAHQALWLSEDGR